MDDYVKSHLRSWNLGNYISIFEEEEIDEDVFKQMTNSLLDTLIKKAGPKFRFWLKWNEEFGKIANRSVPESQTVPQKNSQSQFQSPVFDNPGDEDKVEIVYVAESEGDGTTPPLPELKDAQEFLEQIQNLGQSNEDNQKSLFQLVTAPSAAAQDPLTISNPNEIIDILNKSTEGILILKSYETNNRIDPDKRSNLADAIISVDILNHTNYIIKSPRLRELAAKIAVMLNGEIAETYFVPYSSNKLTGDKTLAKGKLWTSYNKYRTKLRKSEPAAESTSKKAKIGEETKNKPKPFVLGDRVCLQALDNGEDNEDKLQWLQDCLEPWTTVLLYWYKTCFPRMNILTTTDIESHEYIDRFKVLKQPDGYQLMDTDFTFLHADKQLSLFIKSETFCNEVINYCEKRSRLAKNIQSLITSLDSFKDSNNYSEIQFITVFRMLPLLLQTRSITTPKGTWRPSKVEVQNGFFLHVASNAELESELQIRQLLLGKYELPEQPLPVIVGPSLDKIENCYVCINNLRYVAQSPRHAVDITFKSFYALQLSYPKESEIPWLVLQKRIYDITGEKEIIPPIVTTFLNDLSRED